jgi:hypothetical protein
LSDICGISVEIIGASDNGVVDEKYKIPHFKKHNEPYIDDKKVIK